MKAFEVSVAVLRTTPLTLLGCWLWAERNKNDVSDNELRLLLLCASMQEYIPVFTFFDAGVACSVLLPMLPGAAFCAPPAFAGVATVEGEDDVDEESAAGALRFSPVPTALEGAPPLPLSMFISASVSDSSGRGGVSAMTLMTRADQWQWRRLGPRGKRGETAAAVVVVVTRVMVVLGWQCVAMVMGLG